MTEGPQEVTIEQMAADVAQLRGSAEHIDTGVVRIMHRQTFKIALVAVAVIAAVAACSLAWSAIQTAHRLDDFLEQRTVSRDRACAEDNARTLRVRDAIAESAIDGVRSALGPSDGLPPERKAALDKFLADYSAAERGSVTDRLPLRDCSPEGIAAFYGDPKK